MNKNIDIDALSKDLVKRALDKAQADIDRHLISIADDILMDYYEDYGKRNAQTYTRTENFLENSYYLRHHHNQGNNGRRQYRYISLFFAPDKMKEVYHTYRQKRTEPFPAEWVFYQNFNHGYHGRRIYATSGEKGTKYVSKGIRGDNKIVPLQELNREWDNLKKQDRTKFNKMMDEKIYSAFDEVIAEIDERLIGILDDRVKGKR